MTGAAKKVAGLVSRPVAGVILGLGFGFMLEGIKMMTTDWILSGLALLGTMLLLTNRRVPVMFLLLAVGAFVAAIQHPELLEELRSMHADVRLPAFALADMAWTEFMIGAVFLALPQIPLTLGNAVILSLAKTWTNQALAFLPRVLIAHR